MSNSIDETKKWTKTCGLCKSHRVPPEEAEFSFSSEDLQFSDKENRVYVRCPHRHVVWISRKDKEDESLRDAIAAELNDPETAKKIELAKKVREIEKANKREKKKKRRMEEMPEDAGIGTDKREGE